MTLAELVQLIKEKTKQLEDTVAMINTDNSTLSQLDTTLQNNINALIDRIEKSCQAHEQSIKDAVQQETYKVQANIDEQLEQLDMQYNEVMTKIETYYEQQTSNLLSEHQDLLNPIMQVKQLMSSISDNMVKLGLNIGETDYTPKLNNISQIERFNQNLEKMYNLSNMSTFKLKTLETYTDKIFFLHNKLMDVAPDDKKLIVELIEIAIAIGAFISYGALFTALTVIPLCAYTVVQSNHFAKVSELQNLYAYLTSHIDDTIVQIQDVIESTYANSVYEEKKQKINELNSKYEQNKYEIRNCNMPEYDSESVNEFRLLHEEEKNETIEEFKAHAKEQKELLTERINNNTSLARELSSQLSQAYERLSTVCVEIESNYKRPNKIHLGTHINGTRTTPTICCNMLNSTNIDYDKDSRGKLCEMLNYAIIQNLAKVKPKSLKIYICDNDSLCQPFVPVQLKTHDIVNFITNSNDTQELINNMYEETQKRVQTFGKQFDFVDDYNDHCNTNGAKTLPYIWIINLDFNQNDALNPRYQSLIKFAKQTGIHITNCATNETYVLQNRKDDETLQETLNAVRQSHNQVITIKQNKIEVENMVTTLPNLTKAHYADYMKPIIEEAENAKLKALPYLEFLEKIKNLPVVPIEKGMTAYLGYLNGDLNQIASIDFTNNQAHLALAGRNGSGKSVTEDVLMLSLMYKYSYEDINFISADLKGTGFYKYSYPFHIPHVRATSSTHDAGYLSSLLLAVKTEVEARNQLFNLVNVENYKEFKEKDPDEVMKILLSNSPEVQAFTRTKSGRELFNLVTKNKKYPILPRLIFTFDEFVELFKIDEDLKHLARDSMSSLARIARSAGIHLIVTSQNMDGSVDDSTLEQFPIRAVVLCSRSVSNTIIGNDKGADLEIGECIVNNDREHGESKNRYIRVPYCDKPDFYRLAEELENKSKEEGYYLEPNNYNENLQYDNTMLDKRISQYTKVYETNPIVLLGEPTEYLANVVPNYFLLTPESRGNLMLISQVPDDLDSQTVNILEQIIHRNKHSNSKSQVAIVTASHQIENYLNSHEDEFMCQFYEDKVDSMLDNLKEIYSMHKEALAETDESGNPIRTENDLTPKYFIFNQVQNFSGFSDNSPDGRRFEEFTELLRDNMLLLNKLKIYIIITTTDIKPFSRIMSYFKHLMIYSISENDTTFLTREATRGSKGLTKIKMVYVDTVNKRITYSKPYRRYSSSDYAEDNLLA